MMYNCATSSGEFKTVLFRLVILQTTAWLCAECKNVVPYDRSLPFRPIAMCSLVDACVITQDDGRINVLLSFSFMIVETGMEWLTFFSNGKKRIVKELEQGQRKALIRSFHMPHEDHLYSCTSLLGAW